MTVVPLNAGRMTEAEYEQERAKLPADKKDAEARFEQALALLFHRSGWTQEQLAEKEGKKQQWISRRLLFGRFLNFTPNGVNSEFLPRNLTEGLFRSYWDQTNKDQNERARFAEVIRAMQDGTKVVRPRRADVRSAIVEQFADGQWHGPRIISDELDADLDQIKNALRRMHNESARNLKVENKQVGPELHYRIFYSKKQVSPAELAEKLRPIIQKLKIEGKRSPATASPPSVAILAGQLEKLLEEWTQ